MAVTDDDIEYKIKILEYDGADSQSDSGARLTMKVVLSLQVLLAMYLLYARAQYFEDPTKTFSKMTFDLVHRGSFNNSDCLRELLNCWEIIKPELVCTKGVLYESLCGVLRRDCTEHSGWLSHKSVPLYESFCE